MSVPDYRLVPLSTLLNKSGEIVTRDVLSTFVPLTDSSPSQFLEDNAITIEKRDLSRTFLAISGEGIILGFFSLGLKCIRIPDDSLLSTKISRQCNMEPSTKVAQAYLLGQLARSIDSPKGSGDILIQDAIKLLRSAKSVVGCRMLRLDCTDELISYYSRHGFVQIRRNDEQDLKASSPNPVDKVKQRKLDRTQNISG